MVVLAAGGHHQFVEGVPLLVVGLDGSVTTSGESSLQPPIYTNNKHPKRD